MFLASEKPEFKYDTPKKMSRINHFDVKIGIKVKKKEVTFKKDFRTIRPASAAISTKEFSFKKGFERKGHSVT